MILSLSSRYADIPHKLKGGEHMVDMSQSVENFGARNEANFKLLMSNTFRYKVDINDTVFGESMKMGLTKR